MLLFGWLYTFISRSWSLTDQRAHAAPACKLTSDARMSVTAVKGAQGVLPHSLFIIFTADFFVFFLHICFSSDSCVHLIFRRPWQYQVAIQILQVVCCSIDYQVIMDFTWRQWLKKSFKPSCIWIILGKVKMLKWPSDKLHHPKNYKWCVTSCIANSQEQTWVFP